MKRIVPALVAALWASFVVPGRSADAEPVAVRTCVVSGTCGGCAEQPRCGDCSRCGGKASKLRDWLCFRSPERPVCCSCKRCQTCCRPPLYAFFLHRCNGACHVEDEHAVPITFSYTKLLDAAPQVHRVTSCGSRCGGCK